MVQLGYLQTVPVHSTSPNFPYVYLVSARGVRLVQRAYQQLGQEWSTTSAEDVKHSGPALQSVLHELMLTEFGLAVRQTVDNREDLTLVYSQRRFFRREHLLSYSAGGRTLRVIPDFGFLVRSTAHLAICGLVEWDNGTMSLARFRDKLTHYHEWSASEQGSVQLGRLFERHGLAAGSASFRLLIVAHDKAKAGADHERLAALVGECIELPTSLRDRIWLTTAEDLKAVQHEASPLDMPIWLRVRDARAWIVEYRKQSAEQPRRARRRRQFLLDRIASMPRHALFPWRATADREEN